MSDVKKGLNMSIVYLMVGIVLAVGGVAVSYIVAFTDSVVPQNMKFAIVFLALVINGVLVVFIAQNLGKLRKITPQL